MSLLYRYCFPLVLALSLQLAGCSREGSERKEVVARINEYDLTVEELEGELSAELELDRAYKLTHEGKKAFLEQLIQRELLVQEAKKARLDARPEFVRTIERYWEATLIRDLMELKARETGSRVYVSEEEIKERYQKTGQAEGDARGLEECRERLAEEIREEKKRERLSEWLSGLRKKARVEINDEWLRRK